MKTYKNWMIVPSVLALVLLVLTGASAAQSSPPVIELTPGFASDPLTFNGQAGGSTKTKDCGNISTTPNHVINMKQDFPYLRLRLQGGGKSTLLIQEPGGDRTCISADNFSRGQIESPGYWKRGVYSIYIGDRDSTRNTYTLSITEKAN